MPEDDHARRRERLDRERRAGLSRRPVFAGSPPSLRRLLRRAHPLDSRAGSSTPTSSSIPTRPGACSRGCFPTRTSSSTTRPGTTSGCRRSSAGSRSTSPLKRARRFLLFGRLLAGADRAVGGSRLSYWDAWRQSHGGSSGRAVSGRAAGIRPEDAGDPPRRAGASLLPGRALVPAARAARDRRRLGAPRAWLVPGRRALPGRRHHVHAEDALRSSGRVPGPRALGAGGRPAARWRGRILAVLVVRRRRRSGAAHLGRLRRSRGRPAIHLQQLSPQRAV